MDIVTTENINQYDFSENQKNLWGIGNERLSKFYNHIILEFKNKITSENLCEAINRVVNSHEILNFKTIRDQNYKYPFQSLLMSEIDFLEINQEKLEECFEQAFNRNYDSEKNQPIRFSGVKINGGIKFLSIRIYALWGDLYSSVKFLNELTNELINENVVDKENVEKISYLKYSNWQNELLNEPEIEAVNFWKTYEFDLNKKTFPILNEEKQLFSPSKIKITSFKKEEYNKIKEYGISNGIETRDLFFYEWAHYLSSFTEGEITLGYVPYKRNYEELNNTLGYVNKTIPVTFDTTSFLKRIERIKQLRNNIESVLEWSDFFSLDRNASSSNQKQIFRDCFEYIDIDNSQILENIYIHDIYSVQDVFNLKLSCIDNGEEILLELYFDESKINVLERDTIQSQLQNQFSLLNETKVNIPQLTQLERGIISKSNNTQIEILQDESVVTLFKKQVKTYPDQIAIVCDDYTITYKELDEKTDKLASFLLNKKEIEGNSPVCLLIDRSEWFVISVLGILKAGLYYIPIDANYPKERVEFILTDCKCSVMLSNSKLSQNYITNQISLVDPTDYNIYNKKIEEISIANYKNQIAYCIYTSGSTGQPKGCLISNESLYNYINWANHYYFQSNDLGNFGLVTSISFDLTVTSLFTSLTRGKKLYIYNKGSVVDILKQAFKNPNIDTLKLTPTHLSLIPELGISKTAVKIIICGGEELTTNHLNAVHKVNPNILLFNEYGPTEATVGCIVKKIDLDWKGKITVGKPIANASIAILDKDKNICPIGVTGEIMISGYGLSKGYLNREELTSEKFIKSPFENKKLMYKTGDLGRWLPSGEIEFLTRIDDQVKVKGYRIELKEIESCLLLKEGISQASVLVFGKDLEKEIVAFFITDLEQSNQEVREYLKEKIPSYMLPNYFIQLEAFPLTPNGKINKEALLEFKMDYVTSGVEYVAPENKIEIELVEIWEEVLKRKKIGVLDDFFNIGGDSIKAVRIISEVQRAFNVHVDVATLFNEFNVRGLSEVVANKLWHDINSKKDEFVDKVIV